MSGSAKLLAGVAFTALLGAALPAQAAVNIVANGGFETGNFTSWTNNGWDIDFASFSAFSGLHYADTGCVSACTLSQTLTTQAGASYNLSFAFNPGLDAGPSGSNTLADTQVLWNGTVVADIAGGDQGWQTFTINDLLATGSSIDLTFSGYQAQAFAGLDDVMVTLAAAGGVPEPAIWSMLILGFGLTGAMLRKTRGRNAGLLPA